MALTGKINTILVDFALIFGLLLAVAGVYNVEIHATAQEGTQAEGRLRGEGRD